MTSANYWRGLSFTYVTAFSLLRGPKWEQLQQARRKEAEICRRLLLVASVAELPVLRARLAALRHPHELQARLTTPDRQAYDITATPVAHLPGHAPAVAELAHLLQLPGPEPLPWACAPVFRDALAFYSPTHDLVAVLNICFSCEVMQTEAGAVVTASAATYAGLRNWFAGVGHLAA